MPATLHHRDGLRKVATAESTGLALARAALHFHNLRHSAATLLLSFGEHPGVVQECLGHSTIGVTIDTYSRVQPDMLRGAVDKLDALFATVDAS